MKKRILCTGITSSHGWPVYCTLKENPDIELFGIKPLVAPEPSGDRITALSLEDRKEVERVIRDIRPDMILHAGGICDLDRCEEEPDKARIVNVEGTRCVAAAAGNAYMLYCSADLVFSGKRPPTNGYTPECIPDPVSVVGRTFAEAEKVLRNRPRTGMVRVGLPMGASIQGCKGAVDWIESRFKKNLPVTLFYDEFRSAIHSHELGRMVSELLLGEVTGIYHAGGPEPVSLYKMGEVIIASHPEYDPALLMGRYISQEIDGPPRVKNVHLDSSKTFALLGWKTTGWGM